MSKYKSLLLNNLKQESKSNSYAGSLDELSDELSRLKLKVSEQ